MLKKSSLRVKKYAFGFCLLLLLAACQTTQVKETDQPKAKAAPKSQKAEKLYVPQKQVATSTIQEAVELIAKKLAARLPESVQSVAVLRPGGKEGYPNRTFESRVSEALTNRIQPLLPAGGRLVERAKLSQLYKDSMLYGNDEKFNTLLEKAGVDVNIIGSYTLLKDKKLVELSYKAVSLESGTILATSPTVFMSDSVLKDTGSSIMLITRGLGITGAQGGDEVVAKVARLMKQALSSQEISIIDNQGSGVDDPFYSAKREGARILILLDVEGKKEYTNFGNIKGNVSVTAKIYKIPEKEVLFTKSGRKQVLSVSEDDSPILRGVDFVMKTLAPEVTTSLKKD